MSNPEWPLHVYIAIVYFGGCIIFPFWLELSRMRHPGHLARLFFGVLLCWMWPIQVMWWITTKVLESEEGDLFVGGGPWMG